MEKLNTVGHLEWLRNKLLDRSVEPKTQVQICMTGCRAYGAKEVMEALVDEVRSQGLGHQVEVRATGCHGFCAKAPVLAIEPLGIQYQEVNPEDAVEIVSTTLKESRLIDRLAYRDPRTGAPIHHRNQIPFYKKQERRVLANCGRIDPTRVAHYIAAGGYSALARALSKMKPEQVIAEMGMLIDAVAAYENLPDAIGYSYYYFVTDMWGAEKIRLVEVDGIAPTVESISSGKYRYTTAYYAVIRADEPDDSPARQVIRWLLSDPGQKLAEDAGYVPIR